MAFNVSYITNDELKVKRNPTPLKRYVMLDNVSSITNSEVINCNGYSSLSLEFRGSFEAVMKVMGRVSEYSAFAPLKITKRKDGMIYDHINEEGLFTVDVSGLTEVRLDVVAIQPSSAPIYSDGTLSMEAVSQGVLPESKVMLNWSLESKTTSTVTGPMSVTTPFVKIKVAKSQGLMYMTLESMEVLGYENVKPFKKWMANNEEVTIDVRGLERFRLNVRSAYRGADGVDLEKVLIIVEGSDASE